MSRRAGRIPGLVPWVTVITGLLMSCGGPSDDAATEGSDGSGGAVGTSAGTGGVAISGSGGAQRASGDVATGGAGGSKGGGSAGGASGAGGSKPMAGATGGAGGMATGANTGTGGTTATDAGTGKGGASGSGATGPTFHVFLLLGQSNMAGYPKAQDADKVEDERIQVLGYDSCTATGRQQDKWDVAVPPLHECWNGAIGPGDHFARTLIDEVPEGDTIGLVPCAISGEKIETFLKDGGTKYAWILERAKLAQQAGGVIEGFLFHQGESNNGDPSWPGKVNSLVTDLRTDLGIGDVPFLAGELAYDGACAGHNTLVNMLPTVVSNAYVVSANGLTLDPADTQWRLHFGHDSQVMFGQRYAAKMLEALHW